MVRLQALPRHLHTRGVGGPARSPARVSALREADDHLGVPNPVATFPQEGPNLGDGFDRRLGRASLTSRPF